MTELASYECEPCKEGAPKATDEETTQWLSTLNNWTLVNEDNVAQLLKVYAFDDFLQAMAFANQLGQLSEQYQHHPSILVEWGRVTVRWWTHKIQGLHRNDFVMAAKTDDLKNHI